MSHVTMRCDLSLTTARLRRGQAGDGTLVGITIRYGHPVRLASSFPWSFGRRPWENVSHSGSFWDSGGGMDPVTVGAVLLAVATGVSEALGGQLWAGVVSLVRRPLRRGKESAGELLAVQSGETELTALQAAPADQAKAVALAEVLLARAGTDPGFEQVLQQWWKQATPIREKMGNVRNTISGGNQYGPVLQGRDFTGLTFGAAPTPPTSRPGDSDAR